MNGTSGCALTAKPSVSLKAMKCLRLSSRGSS